MAIGSSLNSIIETWNTIHETTQDVSRRMNGINATIHCTGIVPYSLMKDTVVYINNSLKEIEEKLVIMENAGRDEDLEELRMMIVQRSIQTRKFIDFAKERTTSMERMLESH